MDFNKMIKDWRQDKHSAFAWFGTSIALLMCILYVIGDMRAAKPDPSGVVLMVAVTVVLLLAGIFHRLTQLVNIMMLVVAEREERRKDDE